MEKRTRQHIDLNDEDHPKEECGIFGIYSPHEEVARKIFFALYALQHRGQEGAGITTVGKHGRMSSHRGMGLAMQIFTESEMTRLRGHLGIGHARYSTAGGSNLHNAQPFVVETNHGAVAIAHNGQLALANKLRQKLLEKGVGMFTTNDSEVVAQMLASKPPDNGQPKDPQWEYRISNFMQEVEGAYSICVLVKNALFGIRDRLGNRPLCIGQLNTTSGPIYMLSSESCALTTIGAKLIRDVYPGEIVKIDSNGISSSWGVPPSMRTKEAFCVFEFVYFARPDSVLNGVLVHSARQQLGRQLAREAPCPGADIVIGVPDSSTPMAIGYSQESGLPFTEGLCKNRYIGRTFIQPTQDMRLTTVQLKYNPLLQNLEGKNVVMVDDSLVRGNTVSQLIGLLRSAGAKSVHVRIASPPIRYPCYMGIDMKSKEELIAAYKSVEEITKLINADSLAYLSQEGMISSLLNLLTEDMRISEIEKQKEEKVKKDQVSIKENPKEDNSPPKVPENSKEKPETTPSGEAKSPLKPETTPLKEENAPLKPELTPSKEEKAPLKSETTPPKEEVPLKPNTPPTEEKVPLKPESTPKPSKEETHLLKPETTNPPKQNKISLPKPEITPEQEEAKKRELIGKISRKLSFCSACFTGHYPLDIEDIEYVCGLDV